MDYVTLFTILTYVNLRFLHTRHDSFLMCIVWFPSDEIVLHFFSQLWTDQTAEFIYSVMYNSIDQIQNQTHRLILIIITWYLESNFTMQPTKKNLVCQNKKLKKLVIAHEGTILATDEIDEID